MLNGAHYVDDLGYRDLLEGWERDGTYPATYVPTVSRPHDPETPAGRGGPVGSESIVPAVYDELGLTPDNAVAYICGNPDMILAVDQTLVGAWLPRGADQEGALLAEGQGAPRGGISCGLRGGDAG